ncbi:MAG: SagB/ThcOx family dehydrogenase [Thiobacillus sp.]
MAQETGTTKLPAPETAGGMPLMQALKARQSSREFADKVLPPQRLSNLLWAANGVNRPDTGKRTAPSARDWREVDVYVVMAAGAYRYDAAKHVLVKVADGDLRHLAGKQDFVATAPLNLVYVADLDRMSGASAEDKALYSATDTGFIAQTTVSTVCPQASRWSCAVWSTAKPWAQPWGWASRSASSSRRPWVARSARRVERAPARSGIHADHRGRSTPPRFRLTARERSRLARPHHALSPSRPH